MSLVVYSPKRSRTYVRRFDHDEAVRRHAEGETIAALAREYGVTDRAVRRVVTPGGQERDLQATRRWRTSVCETCGGPAMKLVGGKKAHNPDGRLLCRICRAKRRRKKLRYDPATGEVKLACGACGETKPVAAFGARVRRALAEGRATGGCCCTACSTARRTAFRNRRKVPCERCGKPCLPPSERSNRRVRRDRNLCLACYRETELPAIAARGRAASAVARRKRKPEPVRSEAMPANREKAS